MNGKHPPKGVAYNEEYYRNGPGYEAFERNSFPREHMGEMVVKGGQVQLLRLLSGFQAACGLCLMALGIIMVAIDPYTRSLSLIAGVSVLWCPIAPIVSGIVGLAMTRKNVRDFICLRHGLLIGSLLNILFMLVLILTVGFIHLRFLDETTNEFSEDEKGLLILYTQLNIRITDKGPDGTLPPPTSTAKNGYFALAVIILIFAILEVVWASVATMIMCCGRKYYFANAMPMERPPQQYHENHLKTPDTYDTYGGDEPSLGGAMVPYTSPPPPPQRHSEYGPEYEAYVQNYYRTYYEDYQRKVEEMKRKTPHYRWILEQQSRMIDERDNAPRYNGGPRSLDDYAMKYNNPRGHNWRDVHTTGNRDRY